MIHIITGPPCSGKSTYVREHAQDGDVRIDYDLIADSIGNMHPHEAQGHVKDCAFQIRDTAIEYLLSHADAEGWIIHSFPKPEQVDRYKAADAEFIELDADIDTCLQRAEADGRPQRTFDVIRSWFERKKGVNDMNIKTKTFEVKTAGSISGYASTWIREPDSYGDIVKAGAFLESIAQIEATGKPIPLLWNHDSTDLKSFIGTVTALKEDDHGLYFEASFDDTPEAQRARQLAADGRLAKFSFAYDVLDQGEVELEDGRTANELRKLNIHEVSLVMYPANPDTGVIEVKSGRRNSAKDEDKLRQIIALAQECLGEYEDTDEPDTESSAKSEEPAAVNDEERARLERLIKEAETLLTKEDSK